MYNICYAELFVYVGGEMEQWADKVLKSLDTKNTKIICIADSVETIEEQEIDGAEEHEHEHDEEESKEHEHEEEGEHEHEEDEEEEHHHEHEEGAFDEQYLKFSFKCYKNG